MKHFLSVIWGAKYTSWMYSKLNDTFSPWRLALYHGRREAIYQLCDLLPVPDLNRQSCTVQKKTTPEKTNKPCNTFQKSRTTHPSGSSSRRSSTLRASPSTHTQAHTNLALYGATSHYTPQLQYFICTTEKEQRERRKALHEIIKDPAGMQQHSSRCPFLSNRSNESCPSDH